MWGSEATEHYLERLGIAGDLGTNTEPGSVAESIARREAERAAAGVPPSRPAPRGGDTLDAAIAAFADLGGVRFLGFMTGPDPPPVYADPD